MEHLNIIRNINISKPDGVYSIYECNLGDRMSSLYLSATQIVFISTINTIW